MVANLIDNQQSWRILPDGSGWLVCFDDGRPFHRWQPGAPITHPCRADVYRGVVSADPAELRVLWDVSGPGKDVRLFTRCRRATLAT